MGLVWGKLSLGHEITDNSNFTVAKKERDEVKLGIQILLIKSHKQYIWKAGSHIKCPPRGLNTISQWHLWEI